jgi:hypothetical protein
MMGASEFNIPPLQGGVEIIVLFTNISSLRDDPVEEGLINNFSHATSAP